MSRLQFPCRDSLLKLLQLELVSHDVLTSSCALTCFSLLLLMSRHRVSCRDITSRLLQSSIVVHDVATSFLVSRHQLLAPLLLNGVFHDVMTSVQVLGTVPLLVVMSRHQSSCRDIQYINCCCEWAPSSVATSIFMSRHPLVLL